MKELLLNDPTIWVLFSFIVFVVAAFIFGRQTILNGLDQKISLIRNEIEAASNLRHEAEALLADYQARQKDASKEAEKIISLAQAQALDLQKQAEADFTETLARREELLKDRLLRMEETAKDDIRRYAAELAISATAQIIAEKMDTATATKLTDDSIRTVSEHLN